MKYTKADIMNRLTPADINFDNEVNYRETHVYEIFKKIPEEFKNDPEVVEHALLACFDEPFVFTEDVVKVLKAVPKKLREVKFMGKLVGNDIISLGDIRDAYNDQKLIDEAAIEAAKIIIGKDCKNIDKLDILNFQLIFDEVSDHKKFLTELIANNIIDEKFLYGKYIKNIGLNEDVLDEVQEVFSEIEIKNCAIVADGNYIDEPYKTQLSKEEMKVPETSFQRDNLSK